MDNSCVGKKKENREVNQKRDNSREVKIFVSGRGIIITNKTTLYYDPLVWSKHWIY